MSDWTRQDYDSIIEQLRAHGAGGGGSMPYRAATMFEYLLERTLDPIPADPKRKHTPVCNCIDFIGPVLESIRANVQRLHDSNTSILERIKALATIADLDAALAAQETEITSLVTGVQKVDDDVTSLLAKVQAGAQVDVSAELAKIQANTSAIAGVVSSTTAADASANSAPAAAAGASVAGSTAGASGGTGAAAATPPPASTT